jgi:eukaryotic-like serine/threonine-protein kinase
MKPPPSSSNQPTCAPDEVTGQRPVVVQTRLTTSSVQSLLGTTIDGRYTIEKVLGEGGMGIVYLARHIHISKVVALKVLRPDLSQDKELVTRFLNEAQAASRIGNSHIVDISDFGMLVDGGAYFAMEYLRGKSLGDVLAEEETFATRKIVHIAKQIARGLGAAHDAGIVHRDLKPDNIMLIERDGDPDFVKILDFGIAKVATQNQTKLTRVGSVFGTPQYMAPEQAGALPLDHRADIYSLGIMLYEMCRGTVPFTGDNVMDILTHQMFRDPPPLRAGRPDISEAFEAIVKKCLAKKPETRYDSMAAVVTDIEAFERGLPPQAARELAADPQRFSRRSAVSQRPPLDTVGEVEFRTWGLGRSAKKLWISAAVACSIAIPTCIGFVVAQKGSEAAVPARTAARAGDSIELPTAQPGLANAALPADSERKVTLNLEPAGASVAVVEGGVRTAIAHEPGAVVLKLPEGKPVQVRIAAPGFQEKSVTLDAATPDSMQVRLSQSPGAARMPLSAPPVRRPAGPPDPVMPTTRLSSPAGQAETCAAPNILVRGHCCPAGKTRYVFNSCQD